MVELHNCDVHCCLHFLTLANVDYTPVDTVIQFPPSAGPTAVMCQRVPFLDDSIPEPDEFVTLELSESACAISQAQTIVEIMSE